MSIFYHSTRGAAPELDLRGVTMTGLAADGGLYVPMRWPSFDRADLASLRGKSYADVAFHILRPFAAGVIPDADLRQLIAKAYAGFAHSAVTPLRQLNDRLWLLELFHGPTLAFKDVALQLLGHVFDYFLAQHNGRMTVVGATSGDTGSAAMMALAGRRNIDVYILFPQVGPSDIQRKQMTCIDAPNIHALAIDGSFDDCQAIVKNLFNDVEFRERHNLAAVNSINWLRILAQMVYYFVAAIELGPDAPLSFVVPTGNFGNVYAGYAAMQCGLPVSKFAVASNRNDILTRFFATGQMKVAGVRTSLSPSMDIEVSSNFERLLLDLCGGDCAKVLSFMDSMKARGEFSVSPPMLGAARQYFTAASANDEETLATIRATYEQTGVILDPHTAVGVCVAQKLARELPDPVVALACAHPAKFPDTIERAIGLHPPLPEAVGTLLQKPERLTKLPADTAAVAGVVGDHKK